MSDIKTITELGSFGLVVLAAFGVAYVGKKLLAALEHAARSIETSLSELTKTLQRMQLDNASHFAKDDVIQVQIAKELDDLVKSTVDEHAVIKAMIERAHPEITKRGDNGRSV